MFINCPQCRGLVATNPATDLPPERCPRCSALLRAPTEPTAVAPGDGGAQSPSIATRPDEGATRSPDGFAERVDGGAEPRDVSPAPAPRQEASADDAPMPDRRPIGSLAALLRRPPPAPTEDVPLADPALPGEPTSLPSTESTPPTTTAGSSTQADGIQAAHASNTRPAPAPSSDLTPDAPPQRESMGRPAPTPAARAPDTSEAAPALQPETAPPGALTNATLPATATATSPALPDSADGSGPAVPPLEPDAPAPKPAPSFTHRTRATPSKHVAWAKAGVIGGLALLLGLQLLLADRARLSADAHWRPLLSSLCGAFGCTLPAWREPAAFAVLARDVGPHPQQADALRVTATFRNDARWAQPWPRLRLTLSDIDGNTVASRDFAPADYLGAAPTQETLAAGQSTTIAVDLREPGRRSVAFDFQLH